MFRKLLVAIDASDHSRQAVPAAIEVARKFQSDVLLLHVSEYGHGWNGMLTTETPAEARTLVRRAVREFRDAGIEATAELHDVVVGHVAMDIADTATATGSDLIVMGSRGLSDVQGVFLGSVTHKVMQLTHTAVLVVRGPDRVKASSAKPVVISFAPVRAV